MMPFIKGGTTSITGRLIWTDELVEQLRGWHTQGLSGSQMAGLIPGATRNAVIGKLHRLGLTKDNKPTKERKPNKPKHERAGFRAFNIHKPRTQVVFVDPSITGASDLKYGVQLPEPLHSRPYADIDATMCHWPLYYEGSVQMYCASAVDPDKYRSPYCKAHNVMAHPRRGERQEFGKQIKPGKYTRGLGR